MNTRNNSDNTKKAMTKISLIMVLTFSIFAPSLRAQQDIQFTQYMDNALAVNPGYAGSRGLMNATLIHREQWAGMDGRPQSTTFSLNSPLKYESIGLGVSAVNDVVGPIQQSLFYVDASYTLRFKNTKGKLAFGVKAGINMLNARTNELVTTDEQDPDFVNNVQNQISPNFGAGIYYHTPKYFVGVSTPKIVEYGSDELNRGKNQRHYFFIAGGVFDISKNNHWKLRPTTQVKMTSGAPLSVDLSLASIYRDKIWFGAAYRLGDSFGAFFQYQFTPQFKVGIAYDQTVSELIKYNKGTYEVLLSYDFVFKKEGIRSPRYF